MPRVSGNILDNNFNRGVITEATNLNFPENAATKADNVRFERFGKVSRRGGMIAEIPGQPLEEFTSEVNYEFTWENPGNITNTTLVVFQTGPTIRIRELSLDGNITNQPVLYEQTFPGVNSRIVFTSIRGNLVGSVSNRDPFRIDFDGTDFIFEDIEIRIRDLVGIDDGLELEERPNSLSDEHLYNLLNQGWTQAFIDTFRGAFGSFPSNADVWWLYRDSEGRFNPGDLMDSVRPPAARAPRGRFIVNPFDIDRSAVSGIGNFEREVIETRPRIVTAFAGRVWFSGINSSTFTQTLLYTDIIENDLQNFGDCFQVNDPSHDEFFDLLADDGGTLIIPQMGDVIDTIGINTSLLVMTTNGIWSIAGGDSIGFTSTDFSVDAVTNIPVIAFDSIIIYNNVPMWWNYDGIYTLNRQGSQLDFEVNNVTKETIDDLYINQIPFESKRTAKGVFNPLRNEVMWLYSDTDDPNLYNRVLVIDGISQAFSFWSFDTSQVKPLNIYLAEGEVSERTPAPVFVNGAVITVNGEVVTSGILDENFTGTLQTKFLFADATSSYILEESEDFWRDFATIGYPTDYKSFFDTGYRVRGEGNRKGQINYLNVWTENDDPNPSCFMNAVWDYALDGNEGMIGRTQQVHKSFGSRQYNVRRLKIRGWGYAVQFRFTSDADRPFCITGWSSFETANRNV